MLGPLVAASPAGAVSIIPIADGRVTGVDSVLWTFGDQGQPVSRFETISVSAPTPFGPWDKTLENNRPSGAAAVARSQLAGNVLPTQISGSGSAFGTTITFGFTLPLSAGTGTSTYAITFQVDEEADGSLTGNLGGSGAFLEGFASVQLIADATPVFEAETTFLDRTPSFAFDYLYVPGVVYELIVQATGVPDSSSDFIGHTGAYDFNLIMTPEPATLLLVLAGLGVVLGRAARARLG